MTSNSTPRIGLIGGGVGGLTAAIALRQRGIQAHVFERASEIREVGAGVGLGPNAMKVFRALGLEDAIRAKGCEPEANVGRDWITGKPVHRTPLKAGNQARHGAPLVAIHRHDLIEILAKANPSEFIHFNAHCVDVASTSRRAIVEFADGSELDFDLVVGCDGIRSNVRAALHGKIAPRFTGNMCFRGLIPVDRLPLNHGPLETTIWTGEGGHIVTNYVRGASLVSFTAVRETPRWVEESWSLEARPDELLAAFPGVHADLRVLLEQAEHCFKWGLFDHDPLATWGSKRLTLLGDAAHPMLPFLGQGASMTIEDAYVLARELAQSCGDIDTSLQAYETARRPRTSKVQLGARAQAGILHVTSPVARLKRIAARRLGGAMGGRRPGFDMDWLYDFDATSLPA
jgi:salicylate hydroxylase